ncbi:MAG TPA: hypothetical protein IAC62_16200 [Candidatus Pelethocola excrementipullorum]|nr:hypothetical protein [Candidatus Pelethocola excrementipullorum]
MANREYYNVICQELSITGGLITHVDENCGELKHVHSIIEENIVKYPRGIWIVIPMKC